MIDFNKKLEDIIRDSKVVFQEEINEMIDANYPKYSLRKVKYV